jgi:hypothetical protein
MTTGIRWCKELTMNRYSGLLTLACFFLVTWPVGAGSDADPTTVLAKLAVQRRDAARKTYLVLWTNYREGRAPEEVLYRWSLRWLEAERQLSDKPADQLAAFQGHWERMRDVEGILRKLQGSGQVTTDEASAVEYYRVEAEMWLTQAKEQRKNR